ncbi:vacuolar membrane protein-domain-containing protein [Podospora australis]|uniref:Vacuolar membrane protein-domain-containing protein n=1 Tax=Podospora australis TaxID=1536484 RepID=A0AAN7APY4_9PEZI|nr:vacuolar membrane protein-domain-containing protein [Podospora australis]
MTPSIISTITTTALAAATATATPEATAAIASGSPMATDNPTECRLLGSFAILVQLALGGLALLSLVYKRWRERPQRPIKIWFFDASKQVVGSVLVHGANVFMSLLTSGRFNITTIDPAAGSGAVVVRRAVAMLIGRGDDEYVPNPCSFYLLNLAIDTTLGIPILIVIIKILTRLVTYTPLGNPPESVQSGNYGAPPNAWWWLKQSFIYFCGLMGMKLCVLVLFMTLPWLEEIGDWALGWTEGNEKLQIVFVMMLFPLIMNAMQYYIIDSYIKKQEASVDGHDDDDGTPGAAGSAVYGELTSSETDDDDSGDDEEEQLTPKPTARARTAARRDTPVDSDLEYDPDVDGDSQTVIGSSSSHTSNRGVLQKELIPHE